MEKTKSGSKINDTKRKELINFLRDINNSRTALTTHREISIWAIVVLYLTILMVLYRLFIDQTALLCNIQFKILFSIFFFLFFCAVFIFIHSQFGSHQSTRSLSYVCGKYIFRLINDPKEAEDGKWTIKKDEFLPDFIQQEIDERNKEFHKLKKISPLVIFKWVCLRIFKHNEFKKKIKNSIRYS